MFSSGLWACDFYIHIGVILGREGVAMANLKVSSLNLPVFSSGSETREIVVLEFDHEITADEAIVEAKHQGLVYTTYDDVSRFGVEYPDIQRGRSLVFLHEGFTDSSDFPYRICLGHTGNQVHHIGFEGYGGRASRFAFTRVKLKKI